MIVLALETATEICSVAFSRAEQIIAACRLNIQRAHSEKLLQVVKNISESVNLKLNDIDLIAISSGPGSFTGLRIGMASAKGLAFALKRPLVSVRTLNALAFQGAFHTGVICPLIKARVNQVYVAGYEKKAHTELPVLTKAARVMPVAALKEFVPEESLLIGNGVAHFRREIEELFADKVILAREFDSQLNAAATAVLGLKKYQKTPTDEAKFLEPFYVQEFKAKKPKSA